MLKGISTDRGYTGFIDQEKRARTTFDLRRCYDSNLVSHYADSEARRDQGARLSIYSMKTGGDWSAISRITTAVQAFMDSVPNNARIRFCIQHEPEDNTQETLTKDLLGTAAEYKTIQREVSDIIADANTSRSEPYKIRFHGNLIAYSARKPYGNGVVADLFWPGADVWDTLAWDGYYWPYYTQRTQGWEIFQACAQWCAAHHIDFAVNETGIDAKFPNRAQWIDDCQQYCNSVNADWFSYYNSSNWFLDTDQQYRALA